MNTLLSILDAHNISKKKTNAKKTNEVCNFAIKKCSRSKEHCHFNLKNPNNKLQEYGKDIVNVHEVNAQTST
jgi:hypothetical protein